MLRPSLVLLTLLLFLGDALSAQNIPHAQDDTLSGGKITLPDAASGHVAIFTVGFSRAGGDSAMRWDRELRKQLAGNGGVHFYTVAVLQDAPKMVRGMIRHGMRNGVPKNEQETFVLIYEGEDQWKSFADFSAGADGYVVLVDAGGTPRARVHGKVPDEQSIETLKGALAKIAAPTQ
jgi:hypothetical protein